MSQYKLNIAVFNTDQPVSVIRATRPAIKTYGDIYLEKLQETAINMLPKQSLSIVKQDFNVVIGEYPDQPGTFDAILVSGSSASVYTNRPWIQGLKKYIVMVYKKHPHVKLFGSCFGHQLISQCLLGAAVEKVCWEIGVQQIMLTTQFAARFDAACHDERGRRAEPEAMLPMTCSSFALQFIHSDHVRLTRPLPPSWMTVGSSNLCQVHGVYEPGRVLTFQGHFEFDRFINSETTNAFGTTWAPEMLKNALDSIDAEDDSSLVARFVLRWLLNMDITDVSREPSPPLTPKREQNALTISSSQVISALSSLLPVHDLAQQTAGEQQH